MIHAKNGKHIVEVTQQARKTLQHKAVELEQLEQKVGQWIKRNPVVGITAALAVGLTLGWILRKRN